MELIPLVLSGGAGTRLWPLSRALYPKQFIGVTEEKSLFQLTLLRLAGGDEGRPADSESGDAIHLGKPIIVCNEEHRFIVTEQCREIGVVPQSVLLEPVGRNTAPAVAAGAMQAMAAGADPVLLVLPSDHAIRDIQAFHEAIAAGASAAAAGKLVTFGIVPTRPETGYGYIRTQDAPEPAKVVPVDRFVEKPDIEDARRYVADGHHLWNSGMFMFRASDYLAELERYAPEIVQAVRKSLDEAVTDLDFTRLQPESFARSPEDSIDYAVMEKTGEAMVLPLDAGWSDVGAWAAVWDIAEKDDQGNATRGDVLLEDVHNSYAYSGHRLVALVGVENLAVVETEDAVLVVDKDKAQGVKQIVQRLKEAKRPEALTHRKVYRPWGDYDTLGQGARYQVKCITVKPGQKLSVQMHFHRAEHWVVVKGTARVTIDGKEQLVTENQSVQIPLGSVHSLENPGKIPLELIEVQSGSYLGEDDIVRFSDRYGRA